MRNRENWKPSKFVYRKGKLAASRDPKEVGFSSRLMADLIADFYGRNLAGNAKGRLLDLGCGKVPLYAAYKDLVSQVVCVDWVNSWHKNEYLDYEMDLTQRLAFGDDEFDTVILSDVLEHIPTPEDLCREIARILSRSGRLIMNVPFYYCIHEEPHDYYRYTEFALRRFVERCGLKLVKVEPIGGAPEILTDIFAKNILRLPGLGRSLALIAQRLTLAFIRTRFGRKVSEGTANTFPFGYGLIAEKP